MPQSVVIMNVSTLTEMGTVDDEFLEACPNEDVFDIDVRWDSTDTADPEATIEFSAIWPSFLAVDVVDGFEVVEDRREALELDQLDAVSLFSFWS